MYYGWFVVSACFLIIMYNAGSNALGFTAVFEPIVDEFGWSHTQISLAASLRGLERGLLAPVAGILSDRWGPNKVVFGGLILCSIGMILLSKASSLTMFFSSFILIGIGVSATATPLLMVLVLNWFPKNGGLAMGIAASGVALGGLLLPIVTLFIDSFGWRQAIFIIGIGVLVFPLPLSFLLRKKTEKYKDLPNNEKSRLSFDEILSKEEEEGGGIRNFETKEAMSDLVFWIIAVAFFCQVLGLSGVITHIMPFFSSIGFERGTSAFIAGALPLATVLGRVGFGWLMDRVDKRGLAIISFTLNSLGLLILAFITPEQTLLIVLFIIIYGVGWGGSVVLLAGLLNSYFGIKKLSTIIGFCGVITMIGFITGAPLTGWIFDKWGNYQPAWLVLAGILGIATFFFAGLRNPPNVISKSG
jgi:sugar phosphate permease